MSWAAAFVWGLKSGGNAFAGILALFGISSAHLAANLLDDYMDYKILSKDEKYMLSAQTCKCEYLKNGSVQPQMMLKVIALFCAFAALIGGILTLISGREVVLLALAGALIVLGYQKLSLRGLGEFAVFIAYGPLLFEGVYYVMTGGFSVDVFILSLSMAMITEGLIYTHMLLDYEGDLVLHKKTLCCRLGGREKALRLLYAFYASGYLFAALFAIKIQNYYIFAVFLTLLPAVKLCLEMKAPNTKENFYPRFIQARNIITYFALILVLVLAVR
jgi:1,4-dihydroxy-2-naphthoate octaprenyltransferase